MVTIRSALASLLALYGITIPLFAENFFIDNPQTTIYIILCCFIISLLLYSGKVLLFNLLIAFYVFKQYLTRPYVDIFHDKLNASQLEYILKTNYYNSAEAEVVFLSLLSLLIAWMLGLFIMRPKKSFKSSYPWIFKEIDNIVSTPNWKFWLVLASLFILNYVSVEVLWKSLKGVQSTTTFAYGMLGTNLIASSCLVHFIYAKNIPARDVSGDYFDVVRSSKEEYFFTLADVSGKGIKAGMYMAKASSIFRTLANLKYSLEKIVFGVNNELVEAKFKGMFVTAVFGKLNIVTGEMTFINVGHESILIFDQNKNYDYIKSAMPPIGIIKYFTESMVKSTTINIKDKSLVVYTDGVTEGYLKNGEELGAEGVQDIINNISNITPKSIVESIEKELNWGAEKLRDDITCMAINIDNTELIKK